MKSQHWIMCLRPAAKALTLLLLITGGLKGDPQVFPVPNATDYPTKLPRESGFVGKPIIDKMNKDFQIGPGGDLSLSIPLFTIPGKLPVDLTLQYKSGVTLDQTASWVGLGWQLGGWSVKRQTVHGDDFRARKENWARGGTYGDSVWFKGQTRYFVNDRYVVSIPGRTITFYNKGTMETPIFVPVEHCLDSLYVEVDSYYSGTGSDWYGFWNFRRYKHFILTDGYGTRYVFGGSVGRLQQTPMPEARKDLDHEYQTNCHSIGRETTEWMLVAILSHDFRPGGNDPLNPIQVSPQETANNRGWWVAFKYSDGESEDQPRTLGQHEYNCEGESANGLFWDTTDVAYLHRIITPATVAVFNTVEIPVNFLTTRYYRSGFGSTGIMPRRKDMVVSQLQLYENVDTVGRTITKELASVSFDYYDAQKQPLKTRYHQWLASAENGCPSNVDGEPTLRGLVFGTGVSYDHANLEPNGESGQRRVYQFGYEDFLDSPGNSTFANNSNNVRYSNYTNWSVGCENTQSPSTRTFRYQINSAEFWNQSWLHSTGLVQNAWGRRDFWGYDFEFPWAWSLNAMTLPDGATYSFEYESDWYDLSHEHFMKTGQLNQLIWSGGGCRVRQIVSNPEPYYPTSDRNVSETVTLDYYTDYGNGYGYASSMPGVFWSYERLSEDRDWLPSPYCYSWGLYLRFLSDYISHDIIYPRIRWNLSGNKGKVDYYYSAPYPTIYPCCGQIEASKDKLYTCVSQAYADPLSPSSQFRYEWGVWLDRSPMHGKLWKTNMINDSGRTVSANTKFFSFIVNDAVLFNNDSDRYPENMWPTYSEEGYYHTFSQFHDTLAISYFPQIDSELTVTDGVAYWKRYEYDVDAWRRLWKDITECPGDTTTVSTLYFSYPGDGNAAGSPDTINSGGSYRAYVGGISRENGGALTSRTFNLFTTDSAGGRKFTYPMGETENYNPMDKELLLGVGGSRKRVVARFDANGNPFLTFDSDSNFTATFWNTFGAEASFSNIFSENQNFSYFNAESVPVNLQHPVVLSNSAERTASDAFTGKYSLKRKNTGTDTVIASLVLGGVQADSVPSGWYQADGWVKATTVNGIKFYFRRKIGSTVESTAVASNTAISQWQRISTRMRLAGTSRHLELVVVAADTGCRADDIRVAPVGSMVTTATYDALMRTVTESEANNIPTRTYYEQLGGVRAVASYDWIPLSGQERFWKAGETISGNAPREYAADMPNVQYAITPQSGGTVEDFERPIGGRIATWNPTNIAQDGRINFVSRLDGQAFSDLLVPIPTCGNLIAAFDVWDSSLFGTGPTQGSGRNCTNLWFGVENAAGQGYSFAFTRGSLPRLNVVRYTGDGSYTIDSTIADLPLSGSMADYANPNRGQKRIMFAMLGKYIYLFYDGDCIYRTPDRSQGFKFSNFNSIRFRLKSPQMENVEIDSLWIDNLFVYNDPIVTASFLDAFGQVKQMQTVSGDSVFILGSTYTSDGLPEAQFKPIMAAQSATYGTVAGINPGICAFDFVTRYLDAEAISTWKPGDTLSSLALVRSYYSGTAGAPPCTTSTGQCAPYASASYQPNPLRRVAQVTPEGEFGAHPSSMRYDSLTVIVSAEIATDENGHRSAVYKDQKGRMIATVADSSDVGIKAKTLYEYDFDDYVGLITQPNGNKIRMLYNNFGQLIWDSSGDGGQSRLIYDVEGNLRFSQSAGDAAFGRFRYQKYDSLDRVIEVGYVPEYVSDTSQFRYDSARINTWPNADSVAGCVVLKEMHYDNGEFAKGQLSKVLTYHDGKENPAMSYDSLEYDFKGRVTAQIRTFYNLDNANSYRKIIRAEYNNQDQLTKLTYPNGMYITYRYDLAGRLSGVYDALGRPIATYQYWPDGKVRTKLLYSREDVIQTVDYRYNARGWLTDINSVDSVATITTGPADHFGVRLRYDQGGVNHGAWYNGNVAQYTAKVSPTGSNWSLTQRFSYDGLDRLTMDSCFGGYPAYGLTKIAYDLNGNVDSVMKSGTVFDYQYYPNSNRVQKVTNLYAGSDTANFRYTPSGSIDSIKSKSMGVRYDSDERMVLRTVPGVLSTIDTVRYWYDQSGNRIGKEYRYHYTVQCNDTLPIEMALGGGGDVFQSSQSGFIADSIALDSGLTLDSTLELLPDGGMSMAMGGPGQNCVQAAGTLTGYYYFGDDLVAEYTGTPFTGGVLSSNYIYANGERIAKFTNLSDLQYYLTDHLGSVLATIDQSGTVLNKTLYRPYGEIHAEAISNNDRHKYTGHERDQELGSEWDYLGQRYYIPNLKLFTQTDPVRDPSRSPYAYCAGNPMKYTDPDGRAFEWLGIFAAMAANSQKSANTTTNWSKEYGEYAQQQFEMENMALMGALMGLLAVVDVLPAEGGGTTAAEGEAVAGAESRIAANAEKGVPNPGGRLGSPAHRTAVVERAEALRAEGYKIESGGGGSEKGIRTPENKLRFPDISADHPVKGKYYENVGKTTKSGQPVSREVKALEDIRRATGTEPGFSPYDVPQQ